MAFNNNNLAGAWQVSAQAVLVRLVLLLFSPLLRRTRKYIGIRYSLQLRMVAWSVPSILVLDDPTLAFTFSFAKPGCSL